MEVVVTFLVLLANIQAQEVPKLPAVLPGRRAMVHAEATKMELSASAALIPAATAPAAAADIMAAALVVLKARAVEAATPRTLQQMSCIRKVFDQEMASSSSPMAVRL